MRRNWQEPVEIKTEIKIDDPLFEMIMKYHFGRMRTFSEPTDQPGILITIHFPAGKDYETLDAEFVE